MNPLQSSTIIYKSSKILYNHQFKPTNITGGVPAPSPTSLVPVLQELRRILEKLPWDIASGVISHMARYGSHGP